MAVTAGDCHRAWRELSEGSLDDIIGGGTCLILAPHPDDESLGCGGLIAACVAAGRPPLVVILTDGAGSHPNSKSFPPARLRACRAQEVRDAVGILGLGEDRLVFLNQPDAAAPIDGPGFEAVMATLLALIGKEPRCSAIVAPWRYDPHCDHEAAALLGVAVAAGAGIKHIAYPVWGWTLAADAAIPETVIGGFRLDIGRFLVAKRDAIQAHRSQYGDLITDDPEGFRLPAGLLSIFEVPFETFVVP
jgi:LmbE family N-acetylglucosaminyl deacetylase